MRKSFIVMFVALMATVMSCSKDTETDTVKEPIVEEPVDKECARIIGDRLILQWKNKDLYRTHGFDLTKLRLYYVENGTQKNITYTTSQIVDFDIPSTLIHWVADKSFFNKEKLATLYIEIDDKNTVSILFKKEYCWYSIQEYSDAIGDVNEGGDGIIRLGIGINR